MKIAYCFYGCAGGIEGKSLEKKEGSDIIINMSAERMFKKVDCSQFDFFIHTWDIDRKEQLESIYKPKKMIAENQIIFNIPSHLPIEKTDRIQAHYSRWYSAKQCIRLKRKYEIENNFKYDLVVASRLDIYWLKQFDFNTLDNTKFNISQCEINGHPYVRNDGPEAQDLLLASNSNYMDQFHTMYDFLDEYTKPGQCPSWNAISSHFLTVWHLKKIGLWDKISLPYNFWYYGYSNSLEKSDFTLSRTLFPGCYTIKGIIDYNLIEKLKNI